MKFIIIDLDNCISDDAWRIQHINWQKHGDARYHDYHSLAPFDVIGNRGTIRHARSIGQQIVIFTARPVHYAAATRHWLHIHCVNFKHIFFRNNGDARHSPVIKEWMLRSLLSGEYGDINREDIVCAFDDHPEIVAMYRGYGVNAARLAIHELDAYNPPRVQP